jgi:hypothetical protein
MKWFWGRSGRSASDKQAEHLLTEEEMAAVFATVQERIYGFLLDAQIPNYEEMIDAYGMEQDDEGEFADKIEASEERVSRLHPVMGLLHAFAHTLAVSFVAYLVDHEVDIDVDSDVLKRIHTTFEASVMSGLVGGLTQMKELELIDYLWEPE